MGEGMTTYIRTGRGLMSRTAVAPNGQERTFGANELIVSKTDRKGHITYANDVFVRISQYDPGDLVGRPHNVIRHPEMPRGVFALLWNTIAEGRELFAVIDNLASDGAHYWVLAHVTPTLDETGSIIGYHSNRRLPERAMIESIKPLYRRMLAEESRHNRAAEAAQAGARLLDEHLAELGRTYDEFIWTIIHSSGSDS